MTKRKTTVLALCVALVAPLVFVGTASAHPAPYPHRHVRRAPPARELAPAPQPRRAVEQAPHRSIFYLGLGGVWNNVMGSDMVDGGAGFDVTLGFRVSPYASLDFSWMSTWHDAKEGEVTFDRAMLGGGTFDVRVFILPSSYRIEPYAQVGLGFYTLNRDGYYSDQLTGPGLQVGGGVDINLNPVISIGAKALYRAAFLDNADSDWDIPASESATLSVFGLSGDLKIHF